MLSRDCPFYYVNQLAKNTPLHRHNPGIICFIGDDLEIFVLGNLFNAGVNGKINSCQFYPKASWGENQGIKRKEKQRIEAGIIVSRKLKRLGSL